uniref:Cytochrome P450, family 2, subfamily X, polypeptide 9 n=1 Tax=Xiphophorus maculatus TaxID=8083 RepID=A0A3B5QT92_XIPMA
MGAMEVFLQSFSPVSVLGSVVLILIGFHFFLSKSRPQGHRQGPPGPKPLPIIGNLLQLDVKRLDQAFLKLSKTYGSVFTVHMGPKKMVVLTGYKTVKEAFVSYAEEFGEREAPIVAKEANLHHGIAWTNGDSWKEMRRFALTNLKDFGMGKKVCEEKIIEECHVLIQKLKEFKGEAFDSSQHINYAVCNVICSMVYGKRFEYDDLEFTTVVNRTNQVIQLLGSPSIQLYNMFPKIGKLVFSARKKMSDIFAANKQHHLMLLNRLKETLSPQMCRGVADAFLIRQQNLGSPTVSITTTNLLVTVMNLFAAGTETTSTTLRWAFLYMAKYPKYKECDWKSQVQVEDRQNLPFTDAVIHEIQRIANIAPLAIPHRTSQDVTFQGHFIEKGTPVIAVLTSVLQDESEWEKPNVFYPGNFLSKDGKFLKREHPYSTGIVWPEWSFSSSSPRSCKHFRFSPPPGVTEEELDLTPRVGATLSPQPHTLCVIPLN